MDEPEQGRAVREGEFDVRGTCKPPGYDRCIAALGCGCGHPQGSLSADAEKLNGREEPARDDPAEAAAVDPKLEETYKRVWAECFELFPTEDATILSMAFFQAAAAYQPDPTREKDSFCAYMQMAMRHLKAEDARKEAQSLGIMDVSKETARKVRQALDYMDRMGYTSAMVTGDPHLEKTVAQAARIGQRSLHEALLNKDTLVSINTERDDGTGIEIVDTGLSPEDGLELKEDIFPILHKAVLLMSLEEKEKTRANMVLFWSPRILGYLRKMRPRHAGTPWP